jgi:hypothetical protein
MGDIYLFKGYWHRAGHFAIATAVAFALTALGWFGTTAAWLIACEVLPRFLEALDTYAGGFIVTWDQRKRIWEKAKYRRFTLSADSIQDLWEYRLAWLFYPVAYLIWGF